MYAIGSRIQRLWTDGNYYYGSVTQVSVDQVFVQFDDGDTAWLAFHEVEPEGGMGGPGMGGPGMGGPGMGGPGMGGPGMKGGMGGPGMGGPGMGGPGMKGGMGGPGMASWMPGQQVQAQWSDGAWYGATITQVGGPDNFFVTYDDGATGWVQGYQLQPAGGAFAGGFAIGARVQKQWVDGAWYLGTILQIGDDGSYYVQFDDGDADWVAPHELHPL